VRILSEVIQNFNNSFLEPDLPEYILINLNDIQIKTMMDINKKCMNRYSDICEISLYTYSLGWYLDCPKALFENHLCIDNPNMNEAISSKIFPDFTRIILLKNAFYLLGEFENSTISLESHVIHYKDMERKKL